jgi:ATP-dependent DNA helicase DinG
MDAEVMLERYFDPERGRLARAVDGWESRDQQLSMARAVLECLEGGGTCAVEAATGTGKTFAYLVPALLADARVVVATGTKNLQDQIFHKDLPVLSRIRGLEARSMLMKGLSNYICLRRFHGLRSSAGTLALETDPHLGRLLEWGARTRTGDVSELEGVPEGYARRREVVSGPGLRLGGSCPYFGDCFVTRMRREADKAKLVVTNHHLFFADLVIREVGDGVLPDYDAVILDEAHRLDDVATEFFGHSACMMDFSPVLREGLRVVRGEGAGGSKGREGTIRAVEKLARRFFAALGERLAPLLTTRRGLSTTRLAEMGVVRARMEEPYLEGDLVRLYHDLDDGLDRAGVTVAAVPGGDEVASATARRLLGLRDELALVLDRDLPGYVFWAEVHVHDAARTRIGCSPVDLAPIFRERVFERIGSVVLTSATLAPGGDMSHLERTIGLPVADTTSLVLPTPFDVRASTILYVPRDLPEPAGPGAREAVAARIAELVELTGGGALVLFASHGTLRACTDLCRERLSHLPLLVQGEAPRHELTARFRELGDAVLFATSSFREGVDVPGSALRLVIVDKLPFAVPDEPVVEARMERLREQGSDPFTHYQLPEAVLKLEQGLGRLLRTTGDRGVMAVLDPRIWTKRYGSRIRRGLPDCPLTSDIDDVREFWRRIERWVIVDRER